MTAPLVEIATYLAPLRQRDRAGRRLARRSSPAATPCCSGPRAPARRRCCRSSAASSTRAKGEVLIGGDGLHGVPPAKRPTTTVFQDYALFPHMSVGTNVGFGLRMRGRRHGRARPAGARGAGTRRARGGLRQEAAPAFRRPAPARGAGPRPGGRAGGAVLDEPLGALDLKLRRQMQDELKAIQKRVGTAFVHVTHDQEEAMALADHCVVMNEGRIEDEGPPERVYAQPATRFTATFMGESTLLPGTSRRQAASVATRPARLSCRRTPGGATVALAIRPEHLASAAAAARVALGDGRGQRRRLPGQLQARAGRFAPTRPVSLHRQAAGRRQRCQPGDTVADCRCRRRTTSILLTR